MFLLTANHTYQYLRIHSALAFIPTPFASHDSPPFLEIPPSIPTDYDSFFGHHGACLPTSIVACCHPLLDALLWYASEFLLCSSIAQSVVAPPHHSLWPRTLDASQDLRCIWNDIRYLQLACSILPHRLPRLPVQANQPLAHLRHCLSHFFFFPPHIMIPCRLSLVLTFSQAVYIAGALPKPQAHGLDTPGSDSPCADTGSDPPEVLAMDLASSTNTLSAQQTPSGSSSYTDSNTSIYISAITIIQPNRPLTVVTSTDLSSTQVPTTSSASQSSPDTTGVRASIHGQRRPR